MERLSELREKYTRPINDQWSYIHLAQDAKQDVPRLLDQIEALQQALDKQRQTTERSEIPSEARHE